MTVSGCLVAEARSSEIQPIIAWVCLGRLVLWMYQCPEPME